MAFEFSPIEGSRRPPEGISHQRKAGKMVAAGLTALGLVFFVGYKQGEEQRQLAENALVAKALDACQGTLNTVRLDLSAAELTGLSAMETAVRERLNAALSCDGIQFANSIRRFNPNVSYYAPTNSLVVLGRQADGGAEITVQQELW
jgi:hypothetical protein